MNILVLTSVYKDSDAKSYDTSTSIVNSFVYDWVKMGHRVVVVHNSHMYPPIVHKLPPTIKKRMERRLGFWIPDYEVIKKKSYEDNGALIFRLPILKLIPYKAPNSQIIKNQINKIVHILRNSNFVPDVITGHWASPQLEIISGLKNYYKCQTACILHGWDYIEDKSFHADELLKNIDNLGCRSMAQAIKIQKILSLEKRPFICYSGVPDKYLENYTLNVDKFKAIKKWNISFVGRLVKYKNVDTIISALSKISTIDWCLNIIGDGACRNELETLAHELGCNKNVHFWGRVERNQVMKILQESHIFAMVSTNEVFGLVYLEAMAASCITIASRYGGVDGIIVDKNNGYLVEEGNEKELFETIQQITHMAKEDIFSIVSNGYNTANQYTDSKVANRYLDDITLQR